MVSSLPLWIKIWLYINIPILLLDASFLFLRPHSFAGGKYDIPPYKGWQIYMKLDSRYADTADSFGFAVVWGNTFEALLYVLGLIYLKSSAGVKLIFTASALTCYKTAIYLIQYTWLARAQNPFIHYEDSLIDTLLFWVPNGVWIVFPGAVVLHLWNEMSFKSNKLRSD